MIKIKLNIKESPNIPIFQSHHLSFKATQFSQVIPYDEDIDEKEKILIKPKIAIGSKMKIAIKKEYSPIEEVSDDEHYHDEDDDEENETNSPLEATFMPKPPIQQTMVKINVKK